MDLATLQHHSRFQVTQRITLMINRYEVRAGDGDELVAFVEQKRAAFKEQVTLYADQDRQQVLAGFRARQILDVGATYDVTASDGTPIGLFRKDFAKSLARSTWHLEQPDLGTATGSERSLGIALARRAWELVADFPFPIPYHFDFNLDGQRVVTVEKKIGIKDRYVVTAEHPGIDRRLVLAQAIALDALQSR
ncbi:MAG: hypothetical protein GEV09_04225 [Pseudonocardiaceae bacterium]|nr:hypothetical protein [Pseudonocardiaceae bacterium]